MSDLRRRIVRLIEASGPIGVLDYMALCLFDPEQGYYTTREPFGVQGDFTTAPEISQIFGELVGVWIHLAWEAIGKPEGITLAEIGPGRGTQMSDVLRTLQTLSPIFLETAEIALIETSPRLMDVQRMTLSHHAGRIAWHATIEALPHAPMIIVGNELFDAIPMRQYVRTAEGWRERCVALDDRAQLVFAAGAGSLDEALLPPGAADAGEGAVVELAPARSALMQAIARRIAVHGGAGLFIDYGYAAHAIGDTLQALRRHAFADPLSHPGQADLTSHVDFTALASTARSAGLDARLMTQGEFLLGSGLLERAGALGADAGQAGRETIGQAVERLAGPDAMGTLFKALAILPRGKTVAPFGA